VQNTPIDGAQVGRTRLIILIVCVCVCRNQHNNNNNNNVSDCGRQTTIILWQTSSPRPHLATIIFSKLQTVIRRGWAAPVTMIIIIHYRTVIPMATSNSPNCHCDGVHCLWLVRVLFERRVRYYTNTMTGTAWLPIPLLQLPRPQIYYHTRSNIPAITPHYKLVYLHSCFIIWPLLGARV